MDSSSRGIDKVRQEKEAAIKAGNFELAARLRDEERVLCESTGCVSGETAKVNIDKGAVIKNAIKIMAIFSVPAVYVLYNLFVKKVIWCRGAGDIAVSISDPVVWIYVLALMAPIIVVIALLWATLAKRSPKA